jgi:deazaflavin-dependent oxidoreductase (nitroreductase family)
MSSIDTMTDFNRRLIEEFRANGGSVSGPFAGAPLLLLTTTGARTGRSHTTPLVHTRDGDRYVIIASKGGAPTNPSWYHNLVATPGATIEVGSEKFPVRSRVAEDEERDRLFDQQATLMPNFAEYQRNTSRRIPVVVLERVS